MTSSDDESSGGELFSLPELRLQLNLQGIREALPNINKIIIRAKRKWNGLRRSDGGSSTSRVVNRVAISYDPSDSSLVRVKRRRLVVQGEEDAELIDLTRSSPKRSRSTVIHNANTSAVNSYECPLCLNSVHQPCATRCGHIFCKKCIKTAARLEQKCPLCKKEIYIPELLRIYL
ncbi:uncharacterized protein LOC117564780 [Drosophila albomicans]|uniref:Uncharacterized protein LOC117564780 n=1 Tax=Drosophila albomicans TaxID=7291 RepID=A0A6P8WJV0_DROAB|nr:uncharacterized protein LOC117564780 [Drosophila albomicans]XP_051859293.1 uncharacterized protein LOC117564780 [Drosophila albomicans]